MLNRSAIKTGCTLLFFLLTSVGAFAETPFPLEDTQSNQSFLGGIAKGLWTKSFTNQAAGSLGVEAGSRNYRVDATLGLNLTGTQRLKVTSEYLSQAIDYCFLVGTTRQWVQQAAFGLDYQYLRIICPIVLCSVLNLALLSIKAVASVVCHVV